MAAFHDPHKIKIRGDGQLILIGCIHDILSKAKLFEGIPLEHYPQIFNFLQASILSFEKDELIQHLGEPLLYSGIVLDGTVEGSFINENYSNSPFCLYSIKYNKYSI